MQNSEIIVSAALEIEWECREHLIGMCLDYDDHIAYSLLEQTHEQAKCCEIQTVRRGFITNKRRFVDRVEARMIAAKNKQIKDYKFLIERKKEEIALHESEWVEVIKPFRNRIFREYGRIQNYFGVMGKNPTVKQIESTKCYEESSQWNVKNNVLFLELRNLTHRGNDNELIPQDLIFMRGKE